MVGNIGTINRLTGRFTAGQTAGQGYVIAAAIVGGTIYFGDNGTTVRSGTARVAVGGALPVAFALHPNAPNPFNGSTEIAFDLPEDAMVRVAVYNLVGQLVEELVHQPYAAGSHRVRWDAPGLPTGVYVCHLQAGERQARRKMLLAR
ncbi:MAG: T9SS type A sorting domain-containing protein [Candidatus Latescibacterota bacterium]